MFVIRLRAVNVGVYTGAAMLDTKKMRELREKSGLTQAQAAERAGWPDKQFWWHIESGDRADVTLSVLARIAKALKCKPRDLLK
jgi:transcriptional regulator with XRE-family HTH domain